MGIFDSFKPNIKIIKKIGNVWGLVGALGHRDRNVRSSAAEALGDIGEPAVKPLINALNNKDFFIQRRARLVLGKIGEPAVEPLIQALKDKDSAVRMNAALALGDIGDKRAVGPLVLALKDKELYARSGAAEALGKIGDKRAVEPLVLALKDKEWYARSGAAVALGDMGDKRGVEPMIQDLKDKYARRNAAEALGKFIFKFKLIPGDSICLDVEQSYPTLKGGFSLPIHEYLNYFLENSDYRLVTKNEPCDCNLTIRLVGYPLSLDYKRFKYSLPKRHYSGAKVKGEIIFTIPEQKQITVPISYKSSPPQSIQTSSYKEPTDAPFEYASKEAIIYGLAELFCNLQDSIVSALAGAKTQEKYKPAKQPDVTPKRKIKSKIISILKICPFCGEEILPAAIKCKHCGEWLGEKPHVEGNTSGQGKLAVVPEEIKKWNWGAFLLSLIWGIGNNVWIALLCFIPYVGIIMAFVLGAKGSEWAWQKKRWDSIEHFKNVQKKWAIAGVGLLIFGIVMLIILAAITASLR